jgi:hypothetical protein
VIIVMTCPGNLIPWTRAIHHSIPGYDRGAGSTDRAIDQRSVRIISVVAIRSADPALDLYRGLDLPQLAQKHFPFVVFGMRFLQTLLQPVSFASQFFRK